MFHTIQIVSKRTTFTCIFLFYFDKMKFQKFSDNILSTRKNESIFVKM
jgi:hypothetical protein